MFIDYISLMLINMTAGLAVLVGYILFAAHKDNLKSWAPAFAAPGLVALLTGIYMTFTWPIADLSRGNSQLPNLQFANVAFGEMSVLFGVLFLAAAWALAKEWSLLPVSMYAFLAGAIAIVIGIRIWNLGLTNAPGPTCLGFVLTGLGGVLAGPFLWLRKSLLVRLIAAAVMIAAAVIWAYTAYEAYWDHLQRFSTAAK